MRAEMIDQAEIPVISEKKESSAMKCRFASTPKKLLPNR